MGLALPSRGEPLEPWEYEQFRTRSADPAQSGTPLIFVPVGLGNISAVRVSGVSFARSRVPASR